MYREETFVKVELNKEFEDRFSGTLNYFLIHLKLGNGKFIVPQTSDKGVYPVYYIVGESSSHYTYNGVIYSNSDVEDMISTYTKSLLNQKDLFERELALLGEEFPCKKKLLHLTLESIENELSRIQNRETVLSSFSKANTCLLLKFKGSLGLSDIQFFKEEFTYLLNRLEPHLEIKNIIVN